MVFQMCSELGNSTASPARSTLPEDRHIKFDEGTTSAMSESDDDDDDDDDDDIGSEKLMCNENLDGNDKVSDDSDDEELANRVFPQQRFSPVLFEMRRSQTPDVCRIRRSPIAFPTTRAVTPDIYERMAKNVGREVPDRRAASETPSRMVDVGFRAPKGLPLSNKNVDKSDFATPLGGQFVRPKLPTSKGHSPGLIVSGHFQPTGSVFRPSQPSFSSEKSKLITGENGSNAVSILAASRASQEMFPKLPRCSSSVSRLSVGCGDQTSSQKSSIVGHNPATQCVATVSHLGSTFERPQPTIDHSSELAEGSLTRFSARNRNGMSHTPAPSSSTQPLGGVSVYPLGRSPALAGPAMSCGVSTCSSVTPLTVSVTSHGVSPFQHPVSRGSVVLSSQLKPIAPLLSPSSSVSSASGGLGKAALGVTPRAFLPGTKSSASVLRGLIIGQGAAKTSVAPDAQQTVPLQDGTGHYSAIQCVDSERVVTASRLQAQSNPSQEMSPKTIHDLSANSYQPPVPPKSAPLSPRPRLSTAAGFPLSPAGGRTSAGLPCAKANQSTTCQPSSAAPLKDSNLPITPTSTWLSGNDKLDLKGKRTPSPGQPLSSPSTSDTPSVLSVGSDAHGGISNLALESSDDLETSANTKTILKRYVPDGMEE